MVKYKISLTLMLLSVLSVQAENTNSPFYKHLSTIENIAKKSGAAIKSKDWTTPIQKGVFNNALYMRMLLSEFYLGRCGVGASAFLDGGFNKGPSGLMPTTSWLPSSQLHNQHNPNPGNMQPGGFEGGSINAFVNQASSGTKTCATARQQLEAASNFHYDGTNPPNPLNSFAGILLVPNQDFVNQFGKDLIIKVNKQEQVLTKPILLTPTSAATSSENGMAQTMGVAYTGFDYAGKMNGSTTPSIVDISVTSWGSGFTVPSGTSPLFSINGTILGITSKSSSTGFTFVSGYPLNASMGKTLGTFFKNAPNNKWALVVMISYSPTSKNITYTTPALIQLNPMDYPPLSNLTTLLGQPSSLYQKTSSETTSGTVTPNGRLLRAIANGYLTSWKYNALKAPAKLMQPLGNSSSNANNTGPATAYPTPSSQDFENNNNNYMLYALYGTKNALKQLYVTNAAFANMAAIVAKPTSNQADYIGATSSYQPVLLIAKSSSSTQTAANITPTTNKSMLNRLYTHLSKPFKKIKSFFVKRITL